MPRSRPLLTVCFALVAMLLCGGVLFAQGQGRIHGIVTDDKGEPLVDATITVTSEEMKTFKLVTKTKAGGKYNLALVDATKPYIYRVEKDGFLPHEESLKIPISDNTNKDFRLLAVGSAAAAAVAASAGAAGGGASQADPAVLSYNEGVEAVKAKDHTTAIDKFKAALALDPELTPAHRALANMYYQEKKYQEAAASAEQTLTREPADPTALKIRYESYKALGDKAKMQEASIALSAADPAAASIDLYNEGVGLYNAGKGTEAAVVLEKSLAANPDYARAHYMLGLCYAGSGENAKAREHLQKFIAMAPQDPDVSTAKDMLAYLN